MEHIRLPWHSWILVCDGSKALVLRNDGDAELVNLTKIAHFAQSQPLSHDLGTDRPGRKHQSAGTCSVRGATEETNLHAEQEASFLLDVLKKADELVRDNDVKELVLVAPPKALGVLREHLSAALKAALRHEIAKDLVHLPVNEIEKHFA